jgi:hypothetical protein
MAGRVSITSIFSVVHVSRDIRVPSVKPTLTIAPVHHASMVDHVWTTSIFSVVPVPVDIPVSNVKPTLTNAAAHPV